MREAQEIKEYLQYLEKLLSEALMTDETVIDKRLHAMRLGSLKTVEDILKYIERIE